MKMMVSIALIALFQVQRGNWLALRVGIQRLRHCLAHLAQMRLVVAGFLIIKVAVVVRSDQFFALFQFPCSRDGHALQDEFSEFVLSPFWIRPGAIDPYEVSGYVGYTLSVGFE